MPVLTIFLLFSLTFSDYQSQGVTVVMDAIATTTVFLLFISLSSDAKPISIGSLLYPTTQPTSWLSPSGLFAFGFYQQGSGFAVGIWLVRENKTVVWTANRDGPPVTSNAKLQLTEYGKLVLQTEQGQEKLIAYADTSASSASMLDSGNFVLYNNSSSIIWQSFDYPTDTILGGQRLPFGGQLLSSSSENNRSTGRFCLKMQDDGNLVLYPIYTSDSPLDAYWATDTSGHNGLKYHLYLNKTGNLLIRNGSNLNAIKFLYAPFSADISNEEQKIYRAILDFDGFFRLYVHANNGSDSNQVEHWPKLPNLNDWCQIKGFCGFNSYCAVNDDQPYCYCLPGFDYIDPSQKTLGCKRNFTEAGCKGEKADASFYYMTEMTNIKWVDLPYYEAMMSQEDCSSSCLRDCNCWAALYQDSYCEKQGMPFRYVTRTMEAGVSSTTFLKVGNNSLEKWKLNATDTHTPQPNQPPPIKSTSNRAIVQIILVTSCFALFLCSTIAISSHFTHKIRVLRYKRLLEIGGLGLNEEVALRRFSYNELKRATNDFRQELGKGSFGVVYKGALYKGRRLIAVKRLEKVVEEGEREFQAEMRAIGKTHHRNLVRLLGYCAEGFKRLLVYEYMSNGSLGKLLFGAAKLPEWDERVRIALDIARGILYLHEECEAPIIHCDIKPQNILMDEFWTAKISDFGLAKLLMPDQTRTFTGVRGTRGYLAPEWQKNTPISVKADVYSYGIVLLEIVCCRRNMEINVSEPGEVLLSGWAYKCFVAKELNKLVLWEAVDKTALENMIKVALWCIQDEPFLRPTMKSVVLMLEGITDIAIPPCPTANSM